jgi:hypothetical protein
VFWWLFSNTRLASRYFLFETCQGADFGGAQRQSSDIKASRSTTMSIKRFMKRMLAGQGRPDMRLKAGIPGVLYPSASWRSCNLQHPVDALVHDSNNYCGNYNIAMSSWRPISEGR